MRTRTANNSAGGHASGVRPTILDIPRSAKARTTMAATDSPKAIPPLTDTDRTAIKIVSHSMLFYWWPVWAAGLVMAALTYFEGSRMAIVPPGTQVGRAIQGIVEVRDDKEG